MTAWLILVGLWVCGGGLCACVVGWMLNSQQPADEWVQASTVRLIQRPFDFERDA